MKVGVMSLGLGIALVLFVAMFSAVFKDSSIKKGLESNVNTAVMTTLKECSEKGTDLRTTFEGALQTMLGDTQYDGVTINYVADDLAKGVLSVSVTKSYSIFGYDRTYTTSRCVIREKVI